MTAIKRIHQHYPTWTSTNWKPGTNPAVPEPTVILEELRRTTTALRETPSFANYLIVGLAMAYERQYALTRSCAFTSGHPIPTCNVGLSNTPSIFARTAAASTITGAVTVGFAGRKPTPIGLRSSKASTMQTRAPALQYRHPNTCCEHPQNWWYVGEVVHRYQGDLLSSSSPWWPKNSRLLTGPGGTAALLCRKFR